MVRNMFRVCAVSFAISWAMDGAERARSGHVKHGDCASDEGNLGIATITPSAALDVNGTSDIRNTLTLFPNGSSPTLSVKGTAFGISHSGLVNFVSGQESRGTKRRGKANLVRNGLPPSSARPGQQPWECDIAIPEAIPIRRITCNRYSMKLWA
jgi:hypothetical protein